MKKQKELQGSEVDGEFGEIHSRVDTNSLHLTNLQLVLSGFYNILSHCRSVFVSSFHMLSLFVREFFANFSQCENGSLTCYLHKSFCNSAFVWSHFKFTSTLVQIVACNARLSAILPSSSCAVLLMKTLAPWPRDFQNVDQCGGQFTVDIPTSPVNLCLSNLIQFLKEC